MIHLNRYYILDPANELNLKSYQPRLVKTLKRHGFTSTLCMPIEPIIYPSRKDGWMSKTIVIPNKFLKPYDFDKEIVVRFPENMPSISKKDVDTLTYIYKVLVNEGSTSDKDKDSLLAVIEKLKIYLIIGDDKYGKRYSD